MINKILLCSVIAYITTSTFLTRINVDPKLEPYYNDYISIVKEYCNEYQYYHPRQFFIQFKDLKRPIVGECGYNLLGYYKIDIDKNYWKRGTYSQRRQLIYHELTHCIFHVDHTNDPNNYMYAYTNYISADELDKQVKQFLTEHCKK